MAGCAGQGRHARPGARARGGRRSCVGDRPPSGTGWDDGEEKERERGTVEKEKMDTTNGIGCWKSGVRDREKILEIRVQGLGGSRAQRRKTFEKNFSA